MKNNWYFAMCFFFLSFCSVIACIFEYCGIVVFEDCTDFLFFNFRVVIYLFIPHLHFSDLDWLVNLFWSPLKQQNKQIACNGNYTHAFSLTYFNLKAWNAVVDADRIIMFHLIKTNSCFFIFFMYIYMCVYGNSILFNK